VTSNKFLFTAFLHRAPKQCAQRSCSGASVGTSNGVSIHNMSCLEMSPTWF